MTTDGGDVESTSYEMRMTIAACAWAALLMGTLIGISVGVGNRWWGFRVDLGNLAGYVGAGTTLIAVIVAFVFNRRGLKETRRSTELSRQSLAVSERSAELSKRSIEDAESRARLDRVYAHRRETVKAVTDMWTRARAVRFAFGNYITLRKGSQGPEVRDDPTHVAALDAAEERVKSAWGEAVGAAGYAAVLADPGPVSDHIAAVKAALREWVVGLVEATKFFAENDVRNIDRWTHRMEAQFDVVNDLDEKVTDLLRTELPLHDQAEQQAREQSERDAQREADRRALADANGSVKEAARLQSIYLAEERTNRGLDGDAGKDVPS